MTRHDRLLNLAIIKFVIVVIVVVVVFVIIIVLLMFKAIFIADCSIFCFDGEVFARNQCNYCILSYTFVL